MTNYKNTSEYISEEKLHSKEKLGTLLDYSTNDFFNNYYSNEQTDLPTYPCSKISTPGSKEYSILYEDDYIKEFFKNQNNLVNFLI